MVPARFHLVYFRSYLVCLPGSHIIEDPLSLPLPRLPQGSSCAPVLGRISEIATVPSALPPAVIDPTEVLCAMGIVLSRDGGVGLTRPSLCMPITTCTEFGVVTSSRILHGMGVALRPLALLQV